MTAGSEGREAGTWWRRAAQSRLYLELAGLSFAISHGHQPEEYARHLWGTGAARRVGQGRPSPSEYLRWEAEAITVLWPWARFHREDGEGFVRLVFEEGCLGAGWGQPWSQARRLGLTRSQVCRYCEESFRVWGEQLGLTIALYPQPGGRCTVHVEQQ